LCSASLRLRTCWLSSRARPSTSSARGVCSSGRSDLALVAGAAGWKPLPWLLTRTADRVVVTASSAGASAGTATEDSRAQAPNRRCRGDSLDMGECRETVGDEHDSENESQYRPSGAPECARRP